MKNKVSKGDSENVQRAVAKVIELYVENGGRMPTDRQMKKLVELSFKEYQEAKREAPWKFNESYIREQAKQQKGLEFPGPAERAFKNSREMYRQNTESRRAEKAAEKAHASLACEEKLSTSVDSLKMINAHKRGRKHVITPDEALADLRALKARLGRMPRADDITDKENRAAYSYPTYVKLLGPKKGWEKLIEEGNVEKRQ